MGGMSDIPEIQRLADAFAALAGNLEMACPAGGADRPILPRTMAAFPLMVSSLSDRQAMN